MPQDNSLGPAFAQKGRRSWLICQPHGDKETWPGAAEMPLHLPVYTTECCPQRALALCAKVEIKFPDEVCFWAENWGFIYSSVWYVPLLQAEFPIQTWLFSSQHEQSARGKETFSKQFHSSSSSLHQWLPCSVVHYHHLGSLAFLMEYCAVSRMVSTVCVNPTFFARKKMKIGTISRKTAIAGMFVFLS